MTATLAILGMPKAFRGHIGVIQRNAITSWTKLVPRPEIFLFGEDQGVAEIAAELRLVHLRDIARSEYGTPRLDDLLRRAREATAAALVCYANSDIILLEEFAEAIAAVARSRSIGTRFLAVAHRLNIDLQAPIDFGRDWEASFRREVLPRGMPGDHTGIDFFAFPREMYAEVPPLLIGRAWIDQWMIRAAREQGAPVVDVTPVARAIHQLHEYGHIEGGQKAAYWGEEARRNLEIYGGAPHAFTLLEATHELQPDGWIRRVRFRREMHLVREWMWKNLVERTAAGRSRLGLRRKTLRRILGKRLAAKV